MDFEAIRPDNPAYNQFTDMMGRAGKMEWARIEYDDREIDVTMKGIVIARFIPTEDGFMVLYPEGPDYHTDMEDSGTDRDRLTKQLRITGETDTYDAAVAVRTAYRWADSMVDDDEWGDL